MADIQANTLKITIGDKTYIVNGGSGGGSETSSPSPANTVPYANSGSGAVGTSLMYARADHVHPATDISSGGGGSGNLPELTEEHVVGYLNGKPVYEIMLFGTLSGGTSAWNNLVAAPTNIDSVLTISAIMNGDAVSTKDAQMLMPYVVSTVSALALRYYNGYVQSYYTSSYAGNSVKLTISYTKTTD